MTPPRGRGRARTVLVWLVLALAAPTARAVAAPARVLQPEGAFLAESEAAMAAMHAGMAIRPIGDVDADFVAMMIPHHQGAIDMARAVLRYGRNEQLRRLAQEIIVEQQQEIAAMRLAVGQPLPPSSPAPTQPGRAWGAPSPGAPTLHHHACPGETP